MTISTTTRKAGPFNGNGVTTAFPFVFKVLASTDLVVVRTSVAGIDTTLVLNSNYSVVLNADQDVSPGGSVNIIGGAPAVGQKITITTNMPATQPTDLNNGGGFYPSVIELMSDRAVILIQQMLSKLDRTIRVSVTDTAPLTELPGATSRAGKALIFDPDGNPGLSSTPFDDQAAEAAESAAAAEASAIAAAGDANAAHMDAISASGFAVNAQNSASAAAGSASSALTSANNAATSFDNFDDRFLGAKASDPALDNDGNALLDGALYFNNGTNALRVYSLSLAMWQPTIATMRYGSGVPGGGLGTDGDFYIRTGVWDLYGPKTAGVWPLATSLIGPNGPGTGDVLGTGLSVTDEVVLFQGSTGQQLKRATMTGLVKLTAGVLSAASAITDYIVPGAVTTRPLTMATNRLLGRTTAATGAVEEISVGAGMSFAGGVLDVVPPGMVLLATLTPTAAANVDALNIFSAAYDNYLISVDGLRPASGGTAQLQIRLAVAGVTDAGANYSSATTPGSFGALTTQMNFNQNVLDTGKGISGRLNLENMNDAISIKSGHAVSSAQTAATPTYSYIAAGLIYVGANVVTGLRLFWSGGVNFDAVGVIRIYAYKN